MKNDFASILSSTLSHKGYYVVSFETVNETAETVIALEPLLKFVVVEVCGEVGKLAVLRPNLVASVQELICEETSVHAEECAVLYADVVEAHVLRVALETTALLLVVGETVEVVVNGVVVDHLSDRQVPEETRVVGALEILAEDLHEERNSMKKVLILEDEVSIRSFVVINLKRAGYEVVEAGTGEEALELLKANPDVGVAILDIMLPGIDGFEVCRSIRVTDKKIGIIMLTARSQEMDKITGLMTGADDYMTKPFSPAELTARIDALYRRIDSDGSSNQIELKHGPFVLNTRNRTLDKEGRRIKLTQVEYAIVKLFMQNPGRALSREDILAAVWGRDYDGELKIVDVNIRRLRIKIEDDTANPTYITTVWGFGYKWGA